MAKTTKIDRNLKKEAFLIAYKKAFGNVTVACEAIGISRQKYYDWLKEEPGFKETIEAIEPDEILVDFTENALVKRINAGDTTAIIFTLKTKGKKRGYVEKSEVDMSGKIDLGVVYLPPKTGQIDMPQS